MVPESPAILLSRRDRKEKHGAEESETEVAGMTEYYYDTDVKCQRGHLLSLKKELLESFGNFNAKVFEDGAIPKKYKELIAVAAAHCRHECWCFPGPLIYSHEDVNTVNSLTYCHLSNNT